MAVNNPATACTVDIRDKVKALTLFGGKVFICYDPDDLTKMLGKLKAPICGVLYEGIRSKGGPGDKSLGASVGVSIIVIAGSKALEGATLEDNGEHTELLDSIRDTIKRTKSPTGHSWEFVAELPLDLKDKGMAYYQRWQSTIMLT